MERKKRFLAYELSCTYKVEKRTGQQKGKQWRMRNVAAVGLAVPHKTLHYFICLWVLGGERNPEKKKDMLSIFFGKEV